MNVDQLVQRFAASPKWKLLPPKGSSQAQNGRGVRQVNMPASVARFYELCGGLESVVSTDDDPIFSIVPPDGLRSAVHEIWGRLTDGPVTLPNDDRAWHWLVIGRADTDEYFVIDLSHERIEKCYFTALYTFAQPGKTPIVANSYTDLLRRLYKAMELCDDRFWERDRLGDAYD